jgi:hypothetical protein
MSAPSLWWIPVVPVLHLHRYYGLLRPLHARPGGLRSPLTTRCHHQRRRRGGLPRSWGIPVRACLGLETPAARRDPRIAVLAMRPSVASTTSASATKADFGAESTRPAPLCIYASPRQSPGGGARLTTGLPATALAGLDLHQLDSDQRFHVLMNVPPLLRFRGAMRRSFVRSEGFAPADPLAFARGSPHPCQAPTATGSAEG